MNLEQAVAIAPCMQDFYEEDIAVVISSLRSVIVAINHKNILIGVHQDKPTNEKTLTFRCIREKKRLVERVPIEKSQLGISNIAIANPLWNNGELEGVMTVVISDKRDNASKNLDFDEGGKLPTKVQQLSLAIFEDIIEVNVSEQFNRVQTVGDTSH